MSSIYGFLSKDSNLSSTGLSIWNNLCECNSKNTNISNDVFLGCCHFPNHNPVANEALVTYENYVAVIDAVIYNRSELLEEIKCTGNPSDEELLVLYFIKTGCTSLAKVNGDFAGAVFDKVSNTIYVFRDHTGVRPLFYYLDNSNFVFSSDIRGILAQKTLNISIREEWAYYHISGKIPTDAEKTEYNNIFHVKPASILKINFKDGVPVASSKAYWRPAQKKIRLSSEKEYQKELRSLIEDSVKRRLDVYPGIVGAELSGGLDSGVIDILINRAGRKGLYFSWSSSPEKVPIIETYDERNRVKDICRQENIQCNYNDYDIAETVSDIVSTSKRLGLNVDDSSLFVSCAVPSYINTPPLAISSKIAKANGASVVFSGHGGDEGVSHRCNPYELFYFHEYYHYLRYQWGTTHGQKRRIIKTLKACRDNFKLAKNKLLKPFYTGFSCTEFLNQNLLEAKTNWPGHASTFNYDPITYCNRGLPQIRLENAAFYSAYIGMQYVFPYLDYRVLDFALSIPRNNYLKRGKNRYIFREAFKDIIPQSLYTINLKESLSHRSDPERSESTPREENWFEIFKKERADFVSQFDRKLWANILDFTKLDEWVSSDLHSDEEMDLNEKRFFVLSTFLIAQSAITGARMAVDHAEKNKE